jgi:glycerol-3-phosphate dehydrogenase
MVSEQPQLARPLGDSSVLAVEIAYAAQHEMALTLADAVFRRTDLCTTGHPGTAALHAAAQVMAENSAWTEERRVAELDDVRRRLRRARGGRALLADPVAEHAAVA